MALSPQRSPNLQGESPGREWVGGKGGEGSPQQRSLYLSCPSPRSPSPSPPPVSPTFQRSPSPCPHSPPSIRCPSPPPAPRSSTTSSASPSFTPLPEFSYPDSPARNSLNISPARTRKSLNISPPLASSFSEASPRGSQGGEGSGKGVWVASPRGSLRLSLRHEKGGAGVGRGERGEGIGSSPEIRRRDREEEEERGSVMSLSSPTFSAEGTDELEENTTPAPATPPAIPTPPNTSPAPSPSYPKRLERTSAALFQTPPSTPPLPPTPPSTPLSSFSSSGEGSDFQKGKYSSKPENKNETFLGQPKDGPISPRMRVRGRRRVESGLREGSLTPRKKKLPSHQIVLTYRPDIHELERLSHNGITSPTGSRRHIALKTSQNQTKKIKPGEGEGLGGGEVAEMGVMMEGVLLKKGNVIRSYKERWFVVYANSHLQYYENEKEREKEKEKDKETAHAGIVSSFSVEDVESHIFTVICRSPRNLTQEIKYTLKAKSENDYLRWMDCFIQLREGKWIKGFGDDKPAELSLYFADSAKCQAWMKALSSAIEKAKENEKELGGMYTLLKTND